MYKITYIPDHIFNEVERLMIKEGDNFDEDGREITGEEWKQEVIDTCLAVMDYMECNSSVYDAYMDYSH